MFEEACYIRNNFYSANLLILTTSEFKSPIPDTKNPEGTFVNTG